MHCQLVYHCVVHPLPFMVDTPIAMSVLCCLLFRCRIYACYTERIRVCILELSVTKTLYISVENSADDEEGAMPSTRALNSMRAQLSAHARTN